MSIQYLSNNKIIFNGMDGTLMNDDKRFMEYLHIICGIDTDPYDNIYKLNDNWAGNILFIKDNTYRLVVCGSGIPIFSEKTGTLITV